MTIQIDGKSVAIGLLTVGAIVLGLAHFGSNTNTAQAMFTIKGREYQAITARVAQGGDGLYLVDNRTGLMAVFTYDTASRSLKPRVVKAVTDAFVDSTTPVGRPK